MGLDPDTVAEIAVEQGITATPWTSTELVIDADTLYALIEELTVRRQQHAGQPLLSDDELALLEQLSDVAGAFYRLMRQRPGWEGDWSEVAATIHVLQARVMAMAAARAYPDRFRPMIGPR